jgi:hypothetical protein
MDREPDQQNKEPIAGEEESPPRFDPDPALIANFERGGKPSEAEIRKFVERDSAASEGLDEIGRSDDPPDSP